MTQVASFANMDKLETKHPVKFAVKFLTHSQTSRCKFGNENVISSHTV